MNACKHSSAFSGGRFLLFAFLVLCFSGLALASSTENGGPGKQMGPAFAPTPMGPAATLIDFESDPTGPVPNGWQSIDSADAFFTDSIGADLFVADYGIQSIGQAMAVNPDDASFLIINFTYPMKMVGLDFGNDDPGWTAPGDYAELRTFMAGGMVGSAQVVMNRDDIMNQNIMFSGGCFDTAEFEYVVTVPTPQGADGLIEVVDNIVFEECDPLVKEIVSGNDRDLNGEIDWVVEINQEGDDGATMYDFYITYNFPFPVLITDTVPAEWDVVVADAAVNTGFETGDTSGWDFDIPAGASADVVTSQDDIGECEVGSGNSDFTYFPADGDYFLAMKTNGPGSQTVASQNVFVATGMTLSGYAAFDYGDYDPFDDWAMVQIVDMDGMVVATPWFANGLSLPDYADGPWTSWNWTAADGGLYTVRYIVTNDQDGVCDSWAHFDGDFLPDGLNCTVAGANKKDDGKSATKVECLAEGAGAELFWATTRRHNNKKNTKWRPTSCGALYLNDGAFAYELDEAGDPIEPPFAASNVLCLAAVEDYNGDGFIEYNGSGDEDGDGALDYDEACGIGTDPCDPDSDDDGILDGADECPLEGPADPALGEILDPNGCIRQSQCSDEIDNDGDGDVDFPADTGCDDILDDSEGAQACDPGVCGTYSACDIGPGGDSCICFATNPEITEGLCMDDFFCSGAEDCSADPDICAPLGKVCTYQTCCGIPSCATAECTGVIQSSPMMTLDPQGPTASGR